MRELIIQETKSGCKSYKSISVTEALEWAHKFLGGVDVDEDEHFLALTHGMQALADFAELRSVNFRRSVDLVAAQLRKAYERGYNDRLKDEIQYAMNATEERAARPAFVYFIQTATGQIKIGKACDVKARLKGLQTSHPVRLELLATTEGGKEQERRYHKRFADHRLHGEWFEPHPDILAEIERLNA